VPSGWDYCDGTGDTPDLTASQIKITVTGGEVLDTGGSNTHTHTQTATHGHTHPNHDHNSENAQTVLSTIATTPPPTVACFSLAKHGHSWTITNTAPTLNNASITLGNTDGRYNYRETIFIMKVEEVGVNVPFFACNF
jgi:hypothetical protein